MARTFDFTNGYSGVASMITTADSMTLADNQKKAVVCLTASAASKTVTLGLKDGETMIVCNVGGTNALTLKNVDGDTGTSLATGKVALVIASSTADGSKIYVLN